MFRDGSFDNFGEFLDKIQESVESKVQEGGYICTKCGSSNVSEVGTEWKCLNCGHVEPATGDSLNIPARKEESKVQEQDRKDAEQTMKPGEEIPKDDAERVEMEDWSDEDKDGQPKRKDKVERPTELHQVKDEEMSQEVKYERKKDPLHLCNECFKTFRSKGSVCTFCESKNTESLSKVKEAGGDVPFYKHIFAVQYKMDGVEKEDRVEAFDDADAKKMVTKKRPSAEILSVDKIGESKIDEVTVPKVKLTTGQGTSYYADCPKCGVTNYLSEELNTGEGVCKKCYTPFQLGEEIEHEEYIKKDDPELQEEESPLVRGQLIRKARAVLKGGTDLGMSKEEAEEILKSAPEEKSGKDFKTTFKIESKFQEHDIAGPREMKIVEELEPLIDMYGVRDVALAITAYVDAPEEYYRIVNNFEPTNIPNESKLQEQDDVEALRNRRMEIEQKMLDHEKRYQDEQNRMGAEVDRINQQIKAKEEAEKK